jgi:hypothetical protein
MLTFNQRWYELVESYSHGALTKSTDKLIAIAGVARLVESTSHAKYVAGLWSNVAPELGLLWRVAGWERRAQRHSTYIAPTWSWASLDGQVRFAPDLVINKSKRLMLRSQVEKVTISCRAGVGSQLDGGELRITGRAVKCTIVPRSPSQQDTRFRVFAQSSMGLY